MDKKIWSEVPGSDPSLLADAMLKDTAFLSVVLSRIQSTRSAGPRVGPKARGVQA